MEEKKSGMMKQSPKIKQALRSAILGIGIAVGPAQLDAVDQKIADAVAQQIAKAGEMPDLNRTLDTFGRERAPIETLEAASAPEEPAPRKEREVPPTQKTQTAPKDALPATLETPEYEAAEQQEAFEQWEKPEEDAAVIASKKEGAVQETAETQAPPGAVAAETHREEADQRQLDQLRQQKKQTLIELKKITRVLSPLQIQKRSLQGSISFLRIIKWVLWTLGVILSSFVIGEVIAAGAVAVGRAIKNRRKELTMLERQMKPFEEREKTKNAQIKTTDRSTRAVAQRALARRQNRVLRQT